MAIPVFGGSRTVDPVSPHFLTYPEAFDEAECALLIGLMSRLQTKDAGLVDGRTESSLRRTEILWLPEDDDSAWVYNRLATIVAQANRDGFHYALDGFEEEAQIARYQDGGFYDWHIDRGGKGLGRSRKLTISVQLSHPNAYDGGALELNPAGRDIEAPRARGTAVVFPAYMLHRVTPVTTGQRHSLVIWTHGPDFI